MKLIVLCLSGLLLVGCGGGSGGGKENEEVIVESSLETMYQGNSDLVELDTNTSKAMVGYYNNLASIAFDYSARSQLASYKDKPEDIKRSLDSGKSAAFVPYALVVNTIYKKPSSEGEYNSLAITSTETCQTGSADTIDERDEVTGIGLVTINYHECLWNGISLSGSISFETIAQDFNSSSFEGRTKFSDFNVYGDGYNRLLNGETYHKVDYLPSSYSQYIEADLLELDKLNNQYTYLKNYRYSFNSEQTKQTMEGSLYHSEFGLVSIKFDTVNGLARLTGADNGLVVFIPEYKEDPVTKLWELGYWLYLDANGDGEYEHVSWFSNTALENFDEDIPENHAPVISGPEEELQVQKNDEVRIVVDTYDIDYDFVDSGWRIKSKPEGAEASLELILGSEFLFQGTVPGSYILEFFSKDSNGALTTLEVSIIIQGEPAEFSIQGPPEVEAGELYSAEVQIVNINDGPFTYELESAPEGMTIDQDGQISWLSSSYGFTRKSTVPLGVTVKSVGHEVTKYFEVTVLDEVSANYRRSASYTPNKNNNIHLVDLDGDDKNEILVFAEGNQLLYSLKHNGGQFYQNWVMERFLDGEQLTSAGAVKVDDKDYADIFVTTKDRIYRIDGKSKNVIVSQALSDSFYYVSIKLDDIDNDGDIELILLSRSSLNKLIVFDAKTLGVEWSLSRNGFGDNLIIGNVDSDSALEIITSGGYVYDGKTKKNQWISTENFGQHMAVGDIDGDGDAELITYGGSYPHYNKLRIFNVESKVLESELDQNSVCGLKTTNLDADVQHELIISLCGSSDTFKVMDLENDESTLVDVGDTNPYNYHSTSSLILGDVDGDGVEEWVGAKGNQLFVWANNTLEWSETQLLNNTSTFYGGVYASLRQGAPAYSFLAKSGVDSKYRITEFDPENGMSTQGNIVAESANSPAFTAFDYDNDAIDEAMIYARFSNNSGIKVYDTENDLTEWTVKTGSNYGQYHMMYADVNGDGYSDLIATTNNYIEVYDLFDQSLIWNSDQMGSNIIDAKVADLNADGKAEIIVMLNDRISIYKKAENTFSVDKTLEINSWSGLSLDAADTDGDGKPEVIVMTSDYTSNEFRRKLTIYSDQLVARSSIFNKDDLINFIWLPECIEDNCYLGEVRQNRYPYNFKLAVVSNKTGNTIWYSDSLDSQITFDSLYAYKSDSKYKVSFSTQYGVSFPRH